MERTSGPTAATGRPIAGLRGVQRTSTRPAFIVTRIRQWVDSGGRRDEIAILYRVSAQSPGAGRSPCWSTVSLTGCTGGLRFYERAEIRNALAYCRLAANRDDDAAFERIVNLPPRGIGTRTVDTLRAEAKRRGESLWSATLAVIDEAVASSRATGALRGFVELIRRRWQTASMVITLPRAGRNSRREQRADRVLQAGEGSIALKQGSRIWRSS